MEKKKYVYAVTTGINGVDYRRRVGEFDNLADAIKFTSHRKNLLDVEAKIESQQVHYRNTNEFTQFDILIEKASYDEDGYCMDWEIIVYDTTPKFRYGQEVK